MEQTEEEYREHPKGMDNDLQSGPEYDQGEQGGEMEGFHIKLSSQQRPQQNLVHDKGTKLEKCK